MSVVLCCVLLCCVVLCCVVLCVLCCAVCTRSYANWKVNCHSRFVCGPV